MICSVATHIPLLAQQGGSIQGSDYGNNVNVSNVERMKRRVMKLCKRVVETLNLDAF